MAKNDGLKWNWKTFLADLVRFVVAAISGAVGGSVL